MANCPYCTAEIVDELNFCTECEKQVKCLNCGALLYKGKSRCLKCGEPLKQSAPQNEMNTYTLEEKATKSSSYRRIEVKASDGAVDSLMTGLPFGPYTALRPFGTQGAPSKNSPPALPSSSAQDKVINVDSGNQVRSEENSERTSNLLEPKRLFTEDPKYGIIPSKTLRDYISSLPFKKEKQKVFAVMFVWGYREILDQDASRDALVSAMKHEGYHDPNFHRYLPEVAKNYFKTADNHYEINDVDGGKRVEEIIRAIQNPERSPGITETKRSSKRGRSAGKPSQKELETVKPWLEMSFKHLKGFDTRKLNSASEWGAFGLYILTRVLEVKQAVEAGLIYVYLTQKFSTVSVSRGSFVKRMGDTKGKFKKNADGAYYLTTDAEMAMKALIEGASTT